MVSVFVCELDYSRGFLLTLNDNILSRITYILCCKFLKTNISWNLKKIF